MSKPDIPLTPATLRTLTPARVGLERHGAGLGTNAVLSFALDHARARDAVHAAFDAAQVASGLSALGLDVCEAASEAVDRATFLRRPDLGRRLDVAARAALKERAGQAGDIVLVVGDGLSALAVHAHAIELARRLVDGFAALNTPLRLAIVAKGARVALGDDIGEVLGARLVIVLLGERPGLSSPDSLGAYLTYAPRVGRSDAERNCVSNIHARGLSYDEAAHKILWLVRAAMAQRQSGVALKDESGAAAALARHDSAS